MIRQKVVCAIVPLLFFSFTEPLHAEATWDEVSRENRRASAILLDEASQGVMYVGAGNRIVKTENSGRDWKLLYLMKSGARVNVLVFGDNKNRRLYAATSKGLLYSPDGGRSWKTIFKGSNISETDCRSLAIVPYGIILGTGAGLFISYDFGKSWHKQAGEIGKCRVCGIVCPGTDAHCVYVVCSCGLFASKDKASTWEALFTAQSEELGEEGSDEPLDENNAESTFSLRSLCIDENDARRIFLASSKGVYLSVDKGLTWSKLGEYGLLQRDVQFLLYKKSRLFAVTKTGIFCFCDKRWEELSLRLISEEVHYIAMDVAGVLYAACEEGIFKTIPEEFSDNRKEGALSMYLKNEPCIKEIQQAAMQYAEVEPEKILRWRAQAQHKGWLPKLSCNLKNDVTDLQHWETGSTTREADDILRRGRETLEWGISLSWDLSELVWNNDQTSIDVRSRLAVQLRDDILDSVTKLYFERLRVKIDIDSLSLTDRKKRLEKELRMSELTASLDALTGGYFSKRIEYTRATE